METSYLGKQRLLPFLGRSPIHKLTGCFTFAETGEFFGHLLDGHIIHLLSKSLWHNIDRDRVEINHFEF